MPATHCRYHCAIRRPSRGPSTMGRRQMGELQWTPVIRGEPISQDLRSEYRPVQAAVGKAARGRTSPRPSALGCTCRVNMAIEMIACLPMPHVHHHRAAVFTVVCSDCHQNSGPRLSLGSCEGSGSPWQPL